MSRLLLRFTRIFSSLHVAWSFGYPCRRCLDRRHGVYTYSNSRNLGLMTVATRTTTRIPRQQQGWLLPSRTWATASSSENISNSTRSNSTSSAPFEQRDDKKRKSPIAPSLAASVLAVDPSVVEFHCTPVLESSSNNTTTSAVNSSATPSRSQQQQEQQQQLPNFVNMFRGSANYIANHRNTLAVYHIPAAIVTDPILMPDLTDDIALTWLLGMHVVLVAGTPSENTAYDGLSVTTADDLKIVKEQAGYVRFEVERQMARSLRRQQGGQQATTPHEQQSSIDKEDKTLWAETGGNTVSGNFYSAQPYGIHDGVDFQYTGFVRRVETDKIRRLLTGSGDRSRDILLLTGLGASPSGEVFSVNSQSLAAQVAGALDASKVVYLSEQEVDLRHKIHGNKIQSLRLSDARALTDHHGVKIHKRGYASSDEAQKDSKAPWEMEMIHKIGWSVQAVEQGVKRAHIIAPQHGAVLQELYTRDGSGTLISGDLYEGIRQANVNDVSRIYELIAPLIRMGTLVDRPKALMEKDVGTYYVYTRDGAIVACGQLKQFENGFAEIGCLVVNREYRAVGRGDAMLGYLERTCVLNECTSIFVLSTQTMEWFVERGFEEVQVERLPPSRQTTYNYSRNSKIYMKEIESVRDLDANELRWNR